MSRKKPILCVDFDGVVHSYTSPWAGEAVISDLPVPGALRWLWRATEWFDVRIYSSRSKSEEGRQAMREWMLKYSVAEFGEDHPMSEVRADLVTSVEDASYPIKFAPEKPAAFLTIDDRAFCFEGDWNELDPAELLNFKPWNKRPKPEALASYEA